MSLLLNLESAPCEPGVQARRCWFRESPAVSGLLIWEESDRTRETQSSEEEWLRAGGVVEESEGRKEDMKSRRFGRTRCGEQKRG